MTLGAFLPDDADVPFVDRPPPPLQDYTALGKLPAHTLRKLIETESTEALALARSFGITH